MTNAMVTVDRAQRADPRAAGAPGAGRRRPAARRDGLDAARSTTRRIRPRSRPGSSGSPTIPTATSRCPRCQWLGHVRENVGDPAGAVEAAEARAGAGRAATRGRGSAAMLHTSLADLTMNLGDTAAAARARPRRAAGDGAARGDGRRRPAARAARPLRDRRGAARGRRGRARASSTRSTTAGPSSAGSPSGGSAPAELALARGDDRRPGCALYRECAAALAALRLPGIEPTGLEPWGVFGESIALVAHAYYAATDADDAYARDAVRRPAASASCACSTRRTRSSTTRSPAWRCSALGAWGLLRDAAPADDAVELLVLAERFAYNRMIPTMAWERIAPQRRGARPGPDRRAARRARRPRGRPSCSTRRTALGRAARRRG